MPIQNIKFSEKMIATRVLSSTENNKQMKLLSILFQGWRISMEDAHTVELSVQGDPTHNFFGGKPIKGEQP